MDDISSGSRLYHVSRKTSSDTQKTPAICVSQLSKIYEAEGGTTTILRDINLKIYAGEIIIIRGVSGSGKTTLLNILGGIEEHYTGSVKINNTLINELSSSKLTRYRAEKVGFIYQFHNLIPTLTAIENVLIGLEAKAPLKSGDPKKAEDMLRKIGLEDQKNKFPSQLSGGQQQRVAIARALIKHPSLILADEPTGSLDTTTGRQVMNTLISLHELYRPIIILVTHDPKLDSLAHRVLEISSGQIVEK